MCITDKGALKQMIKLCVFDLDGTVMDTLESIAYFVNYSLNKLGFPEIETEKFKYFAGDGRATLIHRALDYVGGDTDEVFRLATQYYDEAYEGNFMYLTKPFNVIKQELQKLKSAGVIIAVLSNKPHNVAKAVIEKTFGTDFFAHVEGQRESVPKKPSPNGFLAIAQKFGIAPDECMMVGDTDVDMITGVNAGAHTMGVLWGFRPRIELEENGAELIAETVCGLAESVISC